MWGYHHHYSHFTDREVKVSTEPPQAIDHFSYTLLPSGWALGIQLVSDAMGWSKTTLRTSLALWGVYVPG